MTHEDCCNHHCLSHFTASEVTATSEYFKSKGVTDQNQFLLDSLKVMLNQESTNHDICGNIIQCKPVVQSLSSKAIEGKTWMATYFDRIGDSQPHMDQIHLLHGLTKCDIYFIMKDQLLHHGFTTVVSLSHYYSIRDSSSRKFSYPRFDSSS